MKRIKCLTPIMLIIIGLTALSLTAGKGVTLRLCPQQGKTYVVKTKSTMISVMKLQGQSMNSNQTMETRQTFSANEVSTTKNVFDTEIDAIKMTVSQMGMNLVYDSDNPQNTSPMLAGQTGELEKALHKPTTITYNELGQSDDANDLSMSQLNNVIIQLPEEEIFEGSKWNFSKTQDINGIEFAINMEYTVASISKKGVNVNVTGTIDSKDVTGTYEGTSTINAHTGFVTSSNIKSNISLTISEQGLTIPTTINSTITVTVEEK